MTAREVWTRHRDLIVRLATEGRARNKVRTGSVRVPAGSVFVSADFAPRLSGTRAEPPYLIEWLGPWDTAGTIYLNDDLEPIWRSGSASTELAGSVLAASVRSAGAASPSTGTTGLSMTLRTAFGSVSTTGSQNRSLKFASS